MKTQTTKAAIAHRLIVTGEAVLNLVWGAADERRAAALEIIARTAYTAEESACHFLETIGLDHEVFENLNSVAEIVRVIVLKTVMTAGLKNIGLAVDKVGQGLESVAGLGLKTLTEKTEVLEKGAGELVEQAGKIKQEADKLKEQTEKVFKKLNIFKK